MKRRNNIPERYKWNLSDIFTTREEVDKAVVYLKKNVDYVTKYKGQLGDMSSLLQLYEHIKKYSNIAEKVSGWAYLRLSEDMSDSKAIEFKEILQNILSASGVAASFITSELMSYGDEYLHRCVADKRFAQYDQGIKCLIRQRQHTLSEEQERIVALASSAMQGYSDVFDSADAVDIKFCPAVDTKGKKHPLSHSTYGKLMQSRDRVLRKSTFDNLYDGYKKYENTLATNYISSLKADHFYTSAYKYDTALQEELHSDDIPCEVYDSLISHVSANALLMSQYYSVRKKLTNIPKLEQYDLSFGIVDVRRSYSFDQAKDLILSALNCYTDEYLGVLHKAFDERWIDVYPTENKETGAYNMGVYGVHPYVLLNFDGTTNDVFTLAHELGHSLHSHYADSQPYSKAGTSIYLAEIASTTNEVLLLKYMYANAQSDKEKIYYLDKYVSMFKSTIFRQTMFSEFEHFAHGLVEHGQAISKSILCEHYGKLIRKYNGRAVAFDRKIMLEWLRVPHFYRPYYVYKYATGMICAVCFASRILDGSSKEDYIQMLKAGCSDYPNEILLRAGIDLTARAAYDTAFAELKWAIDELKRLAK